MFIDKEYKSAYQEIKSFEAKGTIPFALTIFRENELITCYKSKFIDNFFDAYFYFKKMLITLFWVYGGNVIELNTEKNLADELIKKCLSDSELIKTFDSMKYIFRGNLDIRYSDKIYETIEPKKMNLSSDFNGNRIGFDAGGSDRKVTACINGKTVFEKETLWLPKENPDWTYHRDGIIESMKEAASYLDSVDSVGVSTAGVVLDEKLVQAALFTKVGVDDLRNHVETIYSDIIKELFPNATYHIVNDGDVSAIAGSMWLKKDNVLGLAFGTSEASGYCYNKSTINGYFNELGKVPLDYNPNSPSHKSMQIIGSGSMYLSQNGVIRLAEKVGFELEGTLALKLKQVQKKVEEGNVDAKHIFMDMGVYLANALALYTKFYKIENVILLGRVTSGLGGEILVESCKNYIKEYLPEISNIDIYLPDETFRRLGQSYIAASIG